MIEVFNRNWRSRPNQMVKSKKLSFYPESLNMTRAQAPEPIQILIVENDPVAARGLQETLEALNYSVLAIVPSGAQALEVAATALPDLVLIDINLEGNQNHQDGIQTAAQIWERFQIPFIYITSHTDDDTLERVKLTAPFGFLLKPIEKRELAVAVESALQHGERERWMSAVLHGIGDGVVVLDVVGNIRFMNPIAEALTGYPLHQARGQPLMNVFHIVSEQTLQPIENPVATVLESRKVFHLKNNLLLVARDGTAVPIADSIAPLLNPKGDLTGLVLILRDMTTRRQAEDRNLAIERAKHLQQQMAELERLDRAKDDFLNTVSHELRTPIANIKQAIRMIEIVLDRLGGLLPPANPDVQALQRYMDILSSQCDQELFLINDLLDLQRLNTAAYDLEPTSIPLLTWIPHIVESFQERAHERQLGFQLDLVSILPPLWSDLPSLNRILVELLNNACKYTPAGGQITISVRPKLLTGEVTTASPITPAVLIRVCNTGVEIAIEELTRIFEPFYRIPQSDRWSQGGTGLGLALIKKMVTCLSGSIEVESNSEQVCFMVELPNLPLSRKQ